MDTGVLNAGLCARSRLCQKRCGCACRLPVASMVTTRKKAKTADDAGASSVTEAAACEHPTVGSLEASAVS